VPGRAVPGVAVLRDQEVAVRRALDRVDVGELRERGGAAVAFGPVQGEPVPPAIVVIVLGGTIRGADPFA